MAHRSDIGVRERKYFLSLVFIYLTIRWLGSADLGPELLHFYGGDFLFIPILMTSVKIVKSLFNFSFKVDKIKVVVAVIYTSVVFEWLLPNEGTNFVSDPFDIVAYAFGGLLYIYFISKDTALNNQINSLS